MLGEGAPLQVGILTKGKPTLGMVLVSLVLQEGRPLYIHIVDTAPTPVVKRDDVIFAMRLAFDRGVHCGYEYSKEKQRAFSVGRLKLLEALDKPYLVFMDDDIVLAPAALAGLAAWAEAQPIFGYVSPVCKNYGETASPIPGRAHYSPGGIIYQDTLARRILLDYYTTTVDVLDARAAPDKVWENAFLSELFPALDRPCAVLQSCMSYHLDYRDRPARYSIDERLINHSVARARSIAAKAMMNDE
ncbi:MAG: glycosyltransferase family 2 protein [Chloroflexi bacterium]|nr:glycosyltransferase family 2 protein [Chloroflexota bacterium]